MIDLCGTVATATASKHASTHPSGFSSTSVRNCDSLACSSAGLVHKRREARNEENAAFASNGPALDMSVAYYASKITKY